MREMIFPYSHNYAIYELSIRCFIMHSQLLYKVESVRPLARYNNALEAGSLIDRGIFPSIYNAGIDEAIATLQAVFPNYSIKEITTFKDL